MRTLGMALAVLAALPSADLAAQSIAESRARRLGLGIQAGNPTGGTLKYWLDESRSLDAGIGFSGDFEAHAGVAWHAWNIFPQPQSGALGAYVSVAPRIETKHDVEFGLRTMAGASYLLPAHPAEIFLEAGPVFRLAPGGGANLDAAIGVRFYLP